MAPPVDEHRSRVVHLPALRMINAGDEVAIGQDQIAWHRQHRRSIDHFQS